MSELFGLLALILSLVALSRAAAAQRQARNLAHRLEALETQLRLAHLRTSGVAPEGAETGGAEAASPDAAQPPSAAVGVPPSTAQPSRWPEDQPAPPAPACPPTSVAPPPPPRPRGPSLWEPQFSRARISLIGGVLVLGGLAFTLRALGAPAWTLLLAVFAFGGLLYFNARRVPWPVSGALRGLGYGVAALGVGSLSAQLPGGWGPGAVMLGLLGLSAALLLDALRRREPLLGALAVGGAALSTWMLTDDLDRWSIPAAGAVLLLAAVAVWPGRAPTPARPEQAGSAEGAALTLTLSAAGAVPVGWFVASASHAIDALRSGVGGGTDLTRAALHLTGSPLDLLPWLAFSVLALGVPLALRPSLRPCPETDGPNRRADGLALSAAWAVLAPQVLVAAAVGAALSGQGRQAAALALVILAALLAAAQRAWRDRAALAQASPLAHALAGSLTAGAAGVAGALALSVLGPRTEPLALAGVAAALLLVGRYGHSRFWLRVGALGLALTALWGAGPTLDSALGQPGAFARLDVLQQALLGAAPAVLGLLAAWRLGRDGWVNTPRLPGNAAYTAGENLPQPTPRWTPTLLAALCSAVLAPALLAAGWGVLALGVLLAALALWTRHGGTPEHTVPFWVAAPGLTLGGLALLSSVTPNRMLLDTGVVALAGAALLRASPRTFARPSPRLLTELSALGLLTLALGRAAHDGWPALGLPGALALVALLTAPLRLTLGWSRLDGLLALGGVLLLNGLVAAWPGEPAAALAQRQLAAVGGLTLAAVWGLTCTPAGLGWLGSLTRSLGGLPPGAAAQPPVTRALWLGGWTLLVPLALGLRLNALPADLRPWLVASSVALLAVGLVTAVQAHQAGAADAPWARTLWAAGLALIAGAGVKGALLDASFFPNSAAGLGIAVLVTGLSLLAVAILAPRPSAVAATPDGAPSEGGR